MAPTDPLRHRRWGRFFCCPYKEKAPRVRPSPPRTRIGTAATACDRRYKPLRPAHVPGHHQLPGAHEPQNGHIGARAPGAAGFRRREARISFVIGHKAPVESLTGGNRAGRFWCRRGHPVIHRREHRAKSCSGAPRSMNMGTSGSCSVEQGGAGQSGSRSTDSRTRSFFCGGRKMGGIWQRQRIPKWRATVDEDGHHCFAVAL